MPSGPASSPPGTQTKWVEVIYRAGRTYSTYIFIGNRSDDEGRGGGSPPQPWGPAGRGREEESAFTQRPLLSPVSGGPFRCTQHSRERPSGELEGGETLKLPRDVSRPRDMWGAPGVSAGPTFRGPRGGLGSHCPVPLSGQPPEERGRLQSWGRGWECCTVFQGCVGAIL